MNVERLLQLAVACENCPSELWYDNAYIYRVTKQGVIGCAAARCVELWPDIWRVNILELMFIDDRSGENRCYSLECVGYIGSTWDCLEQFFELTTEQEEYIFNSGGPDESTRTAKQCAAMIREFVASNGKVPE